MRDSDSLVVEGHSGHHGTVEMTQVQLSGMRKKMQEEQNTIWEAMLAAELLLKQMQFQTIQERSQRASTTNGFRKVQLVVVRT